MQPAGDFACDFSLEATRPGAAEIDKVAAILPAATPIYITAVPTQSLAELAGTAARIRKAGLEPTVHVAARRIAAIADLAEMLAALRGEADVRRLLVIAGDVDQTGPFPDALSVIQKGRLHEAGIEEIGIGTYPEGHPRIASDRLEAALDAKIAAAKAQGLKLHLVSQFSFSPEGILAWLKRLRACGITVPVKVGMAGPTSLPSLLRYAKRCGVNASLRGLMSGAASALIGNVGPDRIVEALSAAGRDVGDTHPHYFAFGGLADTARFANDAASHAAPPRQRAAGS
jgi:methylenetetrahydrofolate reductase (NADPH)